MEYHELANVFPMLKDSELEALAADIQTNGLRHDITTYQGKILDGRNRYAACVLADVEPQFTEYTGDNPIGFVISENIARRHLDESQRAACAALLANIRNGENQHTLGSANLQTHVSQSEAATLLNVSPRMVASAVKIKNERPDLFSAVQSGEMAVHKAIRSINRKDKIEAIVSNNKPIENSIGMFSVLYVDPPWRYEHVETESRAIENQYPTMSLQEICDMSIDKIADNDCVLFMWATSPKLAEAMQVLEAWKFNYRTCAVWVKDKIGMGYYFRQRHELLLVATRGNLPTPETQNRPDSVIEFPRTDHSKKPDEVYALIERMYPEFIKCELFARNTRKGWKSWGNQAN